VTKRKGAYDDGPDPKDQNTGRMGYRWPEEPPDGRPVINRRPFWTDESERLTYEHAVETNPRRPGERPLVYIQRIATLVESRLRPQVPKAKLPPPAKPMPKQRALTDGQANERWNELQDQAEGQCDEG